MRVLMTIAYKNLAQIIMITAVFQRVALKVDSWVTISVVYA